MFIWWTSPSMVSLANKNLLQVFGFQPVHTLIQLRLLLQILKEDSNQYLRTMNACWWVADKFVLSVFVVHSQTCTHSTTPMSLSKASLISLAVPSAFIVCTPTCVPSNTAIAGIKVWNVMHEEAHAHLFILWMPPSLAGGQLVKISSKCVHSLHYDPCTLGIVACIHNEVCMIVPR